MAYKGCGYFGRVRLSAIRNLRFKIQKVGSHSATPRKKEGKGVKASIKIWG